MSLVADPKEHYLAQFQAWSRNGGAAAPPWLAELRQAGIDRFGAMGFPSPRLEEWRFTDVRPVAETSFALPDHTGAAVAPAAVEAATGGPAPLRLVFVDGAFRPELSAWDRLPAGVTLASLGEAARRHEDLVAGHLGRYARLERNPFTALSTAFLQDGAFVHVGRGVAVERPIYLVFLASGAAEGRLLAPRTLVVLEPEASAAVFEIYAGVAPARYLVAAVSEVVVGDGARGRAIRIQQDSTSAFHMAASYSRQGARSDFLSNTVALGAALSRHDLVAVLDGPGAQLLLNGLSVLSGSQHVDHHTTIDHARPRCESHELFNGIFRDRSRGVFTGRIIVRPGAQGTDSKQTNNNVLLSEAARADSQPQLEIYADDVKCTHGATIGPLDASALFYLRSRGVPEAEARQLLTYGFAAEVIERLDVAEGRDRLDRLIRARLAA